MTARDLLAWANAKNFSPSDLAKALRRSERTVRRWVERDNVPEWVEEIVRLRPVAKAGPVR